MKQKKILVDINYREMLFRVGVVFFLIVLVIFFGAAGYHLIEGLSIIDALFTTAILTSGGGYALSHNLSPQGKIFSVLLVAFGLSIILYGVGILIQFVTEGHLSDIRRRRKMSKAIEHMKDHFIICGFGRVGHQIAAQFDLEKIPYVVIDIKQETALELESKEIPFVIGNVSADEVLEKAGIKNAKCLFATADSDTENVYVTLTAKVLNPDIQVIARASTKEMIGKLKKAGADRVISPYYIAGSRMASMALRPVSVDFLDIVTGSENIEMWLSEVKIDEKSHLANKTLGEARIRQNSGAMILSIKKNNGRFDLSPKAESRMEIGDIIVALGTVSQLSALEKIA